MITYQLESVITENGIIVLPDNMRNLQKHRVNILITDLEVQSSKSTAFLDYITHKFINIEENDLNLNEIYKQRETINERQIVFD